MREKVADGSIVVGEVPACDQVADILTKPLSASSLARFRSLLRVLPVGKMGECWSIEVLYYSQVVSLLSLLYSN